MPFEASAEQQQQDDWLFQEQRYTATAKLKAVSYSLCEDVFVNRLNKYFICPTGQEMINIIL